VDAKDEMLLVEFDWSRMEVSRVLLGSGLIPADCGMELSAARLIPAQDRAVYLLGSQVVQVAGFEPGGASSRVLYDGRINGSAAICGRGRPNPSQFDRTFILDSSREVIQYFHASQKSGGKHVLIERPY
jgi:hypothetical protein